jgi:tyrosine-specific transport protein
MNKMPKNKMFGASLLVAGTSIGAGMLALPVVTGMAGMIPTSVLFIFYWVLMLFTALLILEVNLWMGERANMISMARKTLGYGGELIAWVAYLFLLYALMTAYLAGSGPLVVGFIKDLFGVSLPDFVGYVPLLGIFGYFVMLGAQSVDYVNRILMVGMGVAFLLMVGFLVPHVEIEKLAHSDFTALPMAVSIAATSFGFHIIIPSLTHYLKRDVPKIRQALIVGSLMPLAVYLVWELVTLGVIPIAGPASIEAGLYEASTTSEILVDLLQNSWLSFFARMFALFAIITSFLGVSLSLSMCIADGLHLRRVKAPAGLIDALTFIPPLLITLVYPKVFLTALELAGVFGVIVLLCILPACMVWAGRYRKQLHGEYQAPGKKGALIATLAFSALLIFLECLSRFTS